MVLITDLDSIMGSTTVLIEDSIMALVEDFHPLEAVTDVLLLGAEEVVPLIAQLLPIAELEIRVFERMVLTVPELTLSLHDQEV